MPDPQNIPGPTRQPVTEVYIERARALRKGIKPVAELVLKLKGDIAAVGPDTPGADKGEMIANAMLAYRHLEDAAMRLGKVIQAAEGGVSVYDK